MSGFSSTKRRDRALAKLVALLNVIGFGWLVYAFACALSGLVYLVGVRNDASGWVIWPVIVGCQLVGYALAVQTVDWVRSWEQRHSR